MSTTNIKSVLATLNAGLSALEAAKASAHSSHLVLENAATDAISVETSKALDTVASASKLGTSALVSELALIGVSFGTVSIDKSSACAEIVEIDGILAELEATRKALDTARAAMDTAIDAERTRAIAVRAKLAGIAGDSAKK